MHLTLSGTRNSGISTGAATRRLWRRVQKYPKVPRYCFFCEGVYFLARTRVGTAAARCVCVWIVGGSGPSGPGRAKFFQFIPVLHRVSVLSGAQNQVPVVIYGIHGAWIYSTPYVPVPQILDLPDLPDLPGTVNLGSIPNLRSTSNLLVSSDREVPLY